VPYSTLHKLGTRNDIAQTRAFYTQASTIDRKATQGKHSEETREFQNETKNRRLERAGADKKQFLN